MDQSALFSFTDFHKKCLAEVLDRIVEYYNDRLVSLAVFGSYARRAPRFDSDLDLLVVLNSPAWSRRSQRTEEFVGHIEQHCDACLQELFDQGICMDLSPIILTRTEAQAFLPLYLDMASNCHYLIDRDHFLQRVLERVRQKLARWGSRRIQVSGHWLWEIRPGLKWEEVLRYDE